MTMFYLMLMRLYLWLLHLPLVSEVVFQVLGVPVAAKLFLGLGGDQVMVRVAGRRTLVTSSFVVSRRIFKENGFNYTSRMAEDCGLERIGMLNQGIIWNNQTREWKRLRQYFQQSVNSRSLELAIKHTYDAVDQVMEVFPVFQQGGGSLDLLAFLRTVTLEVTNRLMFAVTLEDRADLISAIVGYFQAWEYFLIRPRLTYLLSPLTYTRHLAAVARLRAWSHSILQMKLSELEELGEDSVPDNFLKQLVVDMRAGLVSEAGVVQCVLEMLIAGTDTSSVSLFYTLVCLAESDDWEEAVAEEVARVECSEETDPAIPVTEACLKEAMRIKPVGPVVIRRALAADPELDLMAGDNVIISLEHMHNCEERFPAPSTFDPSRFLAGGTGEAEFLPFGAGPKSCVGRFLAMREMKAVMVRLLRGWKVELVGEGQGIGSLRVRWDIAQQPVDTILVTISPR